MIFKNRKGEEISRLTGILIAVLCLLLILYVGYRIYQILSTNEDDNAKNVLSNVEGKINALADGQNNTFLVQGFKGAAPSDITAARWYFIGWSKDEQGSPDQCYFQSCLCICKGKINADKSGLAKECMTEGFCRTFNIGEISVGTDFVNSPFKSMPDYTNSPYIRLENNLLPIEVTKQMNKIILLYEDTSKDSYGILDY